jgi:hypothetical protein
LLSIFTIISFSAIVNPGLPANPIHVEIIP